MLPPSVEPSAFAPVPLPLPPPPPELEPGEPDSSLGGLIYVILISEKYTFSLFTPNIYVPDFFCRVVGSGSVKPLNKFLSFS